jgi:hypothetical protein
MNSHRHLATKAGAVLGVAAAALYLAAATLGAGGRSGGAIQLFITPSLGGHGGGSILVTGAFGDAGTSTRVDAAGKADPKGTFSLARLHSGTLLIDTTQLRKTIQRGTERARPDLASCSLQGAAHATVRILSGTGAYAGITGTAHVTFTFAELAGRYTSGPHKGACNLPRGPVAAWASVTGTGSVTFN